MTRPHLLAIACCFIVTACASREVPSASTPQGTTLNTTASWETAGTKVTFRAGPHQSTPDGYAHSFSSYGILHTTDEMTVPTAIESALNADYFGDSPESSPTDFIRLFTSASGKTLLIQEEVPNGCAPCTNHILVRLGSNELEHVYLDLPMYSPPREPGQVTMPIFDEPAEVVAITDRTVTYKYSHGGRKTAEISKLPTSKRPTFPG
ncbi:hypothetical protein OKA04_02695 [Luteolibacter flavescens]|uniref:Lipoprotein n=1 Tax=Luteolibacter flavescens TaxID=1859460 RepID=A0ABT3FJT4_9BACT|nr:hypothetical protein [Luteolibacter flavescens]MCW1883619.1 hypothetical protein [Luteolibacter flavescens]